MRVVSWNVNYPGGAGGARGLTAARAPLGARSVARSQAGLGWHLASGLAVLTRWSEVTSCLAQRPVRCLPWWRSWAWAWRIRTAAQCLGGVAQPWRAVLIATEVGDAEVIAASYHAPPGVSYGIAKPRQAVAFVS
jgi:hypothetical protein